MNNNGQRTPAVGNGTRKPNFRHKNYRYKAQPKKDGKDGQKQGQDKQAKGNYKPQFRGQGKPALKRPRKNNNGSKLKIIPLGGLEQIGMNITAFEYEDSIVVVDCGLAFPEDDMPGIDLVIPDITYLKENISKVKGFVITHGHEDHIGALPYVLKEVNAPIYSTKLTLALISNKLKEHNLTKTTKLKEVKHGQVINLGDFAIEFIKTNHSIQDASALAIYSPVGIVVHTGDFKVDYTPVFGDAIDLQRFAEIGRKGVLALMCDSTNAERPGFTMSERTVGHVFDNLFNEYKTARIIIATFASNVDRVQQIINTAYRFGRKVAVEGRSMVNVITTAAELGYLRVPDQTLIEIDQVKNYPDEQLVLITTGSQGESMAALSRMAANIHKKITIKPNDAIIFSSHPIPGNEKAVSKVINELSMKGAKVIFQDAHVSGHACQEEIKLIYSLVKPKYAIPVHGEYRHLTAQKLVAEELGYSKDNIFILKSGNVLEIDENSAAVTGSVHTGAILVDGLGVGDVGNIVLRDRQHLSEDGIMIVVMTLERHSNVVLAGPDIVSRGFVYVRESEDLMDHAREVVELALDGCLDKGITDWSKIKAAVKDALSDYVWKRTKRSPMILPIIMEA
ncbi:MULTISPECIES: ribonuclease J [unclassified Ruminococcus]|uniref:ribonuclease J n=1 Tax=Ruminococcus sp. 1001136B_160425_D2 TaxID=2787121 RepID=UPI001FAC3CE7|nr:MULTISPECIES: ribonuclease J [unclassified Ruminococcus]MDB8779432.1 ribonuclease J [Ruminococcus sp. 1001136sp1]MDB8786909.1 ribonuclease J [Ruminococcus sp. 1001136sp1]